jgi:signal transduction histidine kinase/DNA-binding response OmpR family regulator
LGSIEGLEIYEGGVFRKFSTSHEAFNNAQIFDIIDVGEYIYIGSTAGLFLLEKNDVNRIPLFLDKAAIVNYLYHHDDILWIGTRGDGLIKYNISNGEKQFFHYDQGLIDLTVNAITFGNDGGLWFSTNLGITRLDTLSHQVEHYFSKDELDWNEFNHNAMTTDDVGNIYFGGTRGIVYFNPKELNVPENPSRLIISRITKRDGDTGKIHEEIFDRTNQQEIVLHHNDRYFSIDFTKSNLNNSQSEQFQYRIDGKDWVRLGNSRSIQFTDLNPGYYNLEIAGMENSANLVHGISIPVTIKEVYYKQWWAYLIYAMALFGMVYWILRNLLIRSKLQAGLSYQKSYNKKLEELAETKTQIFSNLAHEFQTPLTLIQGPAAKIKEKSSDQIIRKWSNTIINNSADLMDMIQQMLKLSRMDEGAYDIQWKSGEFVSFLKRISNSFKAVAHSKSISLSFISNKEKVYCRYDEEKLSHIFKNLLSNALKFTPEGGQIQVNLVSEFLEIEYAYNLTITIIDTGIGISKENIPHIFDRFYQADGSKTRKAGGTGIGLSLVKEFVQLLNGQIYVESHPERGTNFMLSFEFEKVEKLVETSTPNEAAHLDYHNNTDIRTFNFSQNKDMVLIIEDNNEVREFILDCLGDKFEVHQASDGMKGLEKAVELIPDLIISDVMMPQMDGYEFLEQIKKNPLTVQIPCVMLTAKNSDEDRIQGRKSGAEAFLGKPFMPEELEIVVDNLLALKRNAIKDNEQKSFKQLKDPLIQDLLNLLERELDNSNLNVKLITSELALSRSQLHRKIKSLTGKSINQFMREFRLEKAKELLLTGHFHVSEVCYKVGFTQPSYFAARYKEYFGSLPSELIK